MQNGAQDSEEELRISERRHRLLAEHANDVIWTMGVDASITYVSPAVEAMRGITPAEAMAQSIDQIHPPESAARSVGYFTELYARLEQGLEPHEFRGELEYYCKDGSTVWTDVQVIPHIDDAGALIEILGVTRDISDRKRHEDELQAARDATAAANEALSQANRELERLAMTDDLTGLWNRRQAFQRGEEEIRRAQRSGDPLSLLLIDLDRFKSVNDTMGHVRGDGVLIDTARILSASIREVDLVARWGGEEFLVLAPATSAEDAELLAERVRRAVETESRDPNVTVSIGLASWTAGDTLADLVQRADTALYAAKDSGRNTVRSA